MIKMETGIKVFKTEEKGYVLELWGEGALNIQIAFFILMILKKLILLKRNIKSFNGC